MKRAQTVHQAEGGAVAALMGAMMFIARISAKNGRKLYETREYRTRKEAAAVAFEQRPKAMSCSTTRAVWVENLQAWRSYGMDLRWHDCRSMEGAPPIAED